MKIREPFSFNNFITNSDKMIKVLELAEKVAPMDSSIFIHGETGVGKKGC
ncbi:sigma 54-interacting transcriptional regulator [Peribacillus frigoritolerans]|nr:sigma 54-interacting transcriptional regulator [Peribacillus frigoritolerans]